MSNWTPERIRSLLVDKGWTQTELAQRLSTPGAAVPTSTIARWLSTTNPRTPSKSYQRELDRLIEEREGVSK